MNGNGWAGSTASGVSTGKNWRSNSSESWRRSPARSSSQLSISRPCWRRAGSRSCIEQPPLARHHRPRLGVDRGELLEGRAVGAGVELAHVAGELLLQAPHPLHEELVEVRIEDGDELQPLEQRIGRVLGLVQHAGVELQPRELPVEEIGGFDDLFERLHTGRVRFGHGRSASGGSGERALPPGKSAQKSVTSRAKARVTAM